MTPPTTSQPSDRTAEPDRASTEVLDRLFNALWREGFAVTRRLFRRGESSGVAVVRLADGSLMAAGVRGHHALDRLRTCPPYAVRRDGRFRRIQTAAEAAAALEDLGPLTDDLAQSEGNMRRFLDSTRARAPRLSGQGGLLTRVFEGGEALDVAPEAFLEGFLATGHPMHPGTKMRIGLDPDQLARYSPEMGATVGLRFVALARTHCISRRVPGPRAELPFEDDVRAVMGPLAETHVPLAVHPWQAEQVLPIRFERELADGTLRFLDLVRPARPLISVRTLVPVDALNGVHVKLPVALQMTSAMRTVSPQSAQNGPALSAWLEPVLAELPGISLQCERLGRHFATPGEDPCDPAGLDRGKHLSMLLRDACRSVPGTWLLPATVLTETCPITEKAMVAEVLERSGLSPEAWMAAYATLLADALVPLLLHYGVAAEAHSQNSIIRFAEGRPVELVLRDLGGIRAWRPWMRGAPDLHPASVITASSLEELIAKGHHAWLQGHLGPLATALSEVSGTREADLWKPIREAFHAAFDREAHAAETRAAFFAPRIHVKALTRMRLGGRSHHYDFCEVDNPLA